MVLTDELERLRKTNAEFARYKKKLEDRLGLVNNNYYNISKSRKGIDKDKSVKGRNDDCPDFDDTAPSASTDNVSLDTSSLFIRVLVVRVLPIRKKSWVILSNINVTVRNFHLVR